MLSYDWCYFMLNLKSPNDMIIYHLCIYCVLKSVYTYGYKISRETTKTSLDIRS